MTEIPIDVLAQFFTVFLDRAPDDLVHDLLKLAHFLPRQRLGNLCLRQFCFLVFYLCIFFHFHIFLPAHVTLSCSRFPENRLCLRFQKRFRFCFLIFFHFSKDSPYGFQLVPLFLQLLDLTEQLDMKLRIVPMPQFISRNRKPQLVLPVPEHVSLHLHLSGSIRNQVMLVLIHSACPPRYLTTTICGVQTKYE